MRPGNWVLLGSCLGEGIRASRGVLECRCLVQYRPAPLMGGLHTLTAAGVTVSGIAATLVIAPLSGVWRVYASVLSGVL